MKPNTVRNEIIKLRNDKMSYMDISRQLNISFNEVKNVLNYNLKIHRKKVGPKSKIGKVEKLRIKRQISLYQNLGQKVDSHKLKNDCNLNSSTRTIQRHMKTIQFYYKKIKSKILLSQKHKENRLKMCIDWLAKNHDWTKTIFSDEKWFSFDGPDNWCSYVSKDNNMFRSRRQKGGGGVMIWLMVLPNGLTCFQYIAGNFKSTNYIELLKRVTVPIIKLNYGEDFYFQQDNSPIHRSQLVKKFFNESDIKLLEWPPMSPDINIVEDMWKKLSSMVYDGPQFSNKTDILIKIKQAVDTINSTDRMFVQNLYSTIRSRLCKIIIKKGDLCNK